MTLPKAGVMAGHGHPKLGNLPAEVCDGEGLSAGCCVSGTTVADGGANGIGSYFTGQALFHENETSCLVAVQIRTVRHVLATPNAYPHLPLIHVSGRVAYRLAVQSSGRCGPLSA